MTSFSLYTAPYHPFALSLSKGPRPSSRRGTRSPCTRSPWACRRARAPELVGATLVVALSTSTPTRTCVEGPAPRSLGHPFRVHTRPAALSLSKGPHP